MRYFRALMAIATGALTALPLTLKMFNIDMIVPLTGR